MSAHTNVNLLLRFLYHLALSLTIRINIVYSIFMAEVQGEKAFVI